MRRIQDNNPSVIHINQNTLPIVTTHAKERSIPHAIEVEKELPTIAFRDVSHPPRIPKIVIH